MPNPPAELAWLGIVASAVAIIVGSINLLILWRNRSRIEFRVVTAKVYCQRYHEDDIRRAADPEHGRLVVVRPGDCREAFIILEFAFRNLHAYDITIGRFLVDKWMFSEKYTRGMYHPMRDYRVFDLYDRTPTSLDKFTKLEKGDSLGLRIEVLEESAGPVWMPHDRSAVKLPKNYLIEFLQDGTKRRLKVKLPRPVESGSIDLVDVDRWSNLLGPVQPSSTGAPLPAGINPGDLGHTTWQERLRDWLASLYNHRVLHWIARPAYSLALFLSNYTSR